MHPPYQHSVCIYQAGSLNRAPLSTCSTPSLVNYSLITSLCQLRHHLILTEVLLTLGHRSALSLPRRTRSPIYRTTIFGGTTEAASLQRLRRLQSIHRRVRRLISPLSGIPPTTTLPLTSPVVARPPSHQTILPHPSSPHCLPRTIPRRHSNYSLLGAATQLSQSPV